MEYEIEDELGQGGMAIVYRATRTATGEVFAMKRPRAFEHCEERLQREISVMTRIDHPHVMPVLDHGTDEDGYHWYAMPLAPGNLKALWEEGSLGTDVEAVCHQVLADICVGLQAMHDLGYVHRDVKPQNIIALSDTDRPEGFRWVIADCGVVRRPLGETTRDLTGSASRVGTTGYMAPEAFGDPHLVTQAADIYSLGRVFACLLTGKKPILTEPLLPEGSWRPVVRAFTQQTPSRRPQSMGEALDTAREDLRAFHVPDKVSFRSQLAAKGGGLRMDNPLWDVVLEHLDDYDFMIDDLSAIDPSAVEKLAIADPEKAATIATRLAQHLAEGDFGLRQFDQTNTHLGWILSALKGLAAVGQAGLFEDVAVPYCEAVEQWDRYPHNDLLRRWLPGLTGPIGDAMASAIRQAKAINYFRGIIGSRRISNDRLAGLLED